MRISHRAGCDEVARARRFEIATLKVNEADVCNWCGTFGRTAFIAASFKWDGQELCRACLLAVAKRLRNESGAARSPAPARTGPADSGSRTDGEPS